MRLLITLLQSLRGHVRVHLGRVQALVAEQFLHAADVGAGVEHVRGEAVAQRVRAGSRVEPGRREVLRQQPADASRREPAAAVVQKDRRVPSGRLQRYSGAVGPARR